VNIASPELDYRQYLRLDMMPHMLCPGCGHGIVLKAILRAVHRLALPRENVVFVSGIGCSSRIVGYVDFCTLHTTHGRPLTFATGLKLARPELKVLVITGDGDGLAIGGNHLIHAARRNIDITCLLLNNAIYGMTGGQGAPTTPPGARSSISPRGTTEPAFDACRLAVGAGATFVGRGLTAHPLALDDLIAQAIVHRGFSFVEVLSDCPEYFGRYNALGRGPEMLQAQRSHLEFVEDSLDVKKFVPGLACDAAPAPEPSVISGVLHRETRAEFAETLQHAAPAPTSPSAKPEDLLAPVNDEASRPGPARIRLAGAGGQGVVLAGLLLAEAAVASGRNATQTQVYGPESRGGASKSEVIISDGEITYPYADRVDLLLALTQEAHDRYVGQLETAGLLLFDDGLVRPAAGNGVTRHGLPITATAMRVLGTAIGANLVALGALVELFGAVPIKALEHAVAVRRPGGSAERGIAALRAGRELVRGR
jgi:2-oxoglutarate ferredoxin oxidoreductase subunit beta